MAFIKKWFFTVAVTVAITVASLIPIPEVPELQDVPFFDKWVHFVMYGAMTFAMWIDRYKPPYPLKGESAPKSPKGDLLPKGNTTPPSGGWGAFSFLLPSLWGGLMELAQAYLTTCRSGDWLDFYADAFGALLAVIISYSIWKIVEKISAAR